MKKDRVKWNIRYGSGDFYLGRDPSPFLAENMDLISSLTMGRKALDIACGEGRNSVFLARNGFSVTGLDISEEGLAKGEEWARLEGVDATFRPADLETFEFTEQYDLIINFNFLLRPLIPKMVDTLNPDGVIVFDTILDAPSLEGNHNRTYLLQPGELRRLFSRFRGRIVACEELPSGPMPTARLIFHKNDADPADKEKFS